MNEAPTEKMTRRNGSPNVSRVKVSARKLPDAPPKIGQKASRGDLKKGTGNTDKSGSIGRNSNPGSRSRDGK
jgi:hypothetical protein